VFFFVGVQGRVVVGFGGLVGLVFLCVVAFGLWGVHSRLISRSHPPFLNPRSSFSF